jgi:hypothetical protein
LLPSQEPSQDHLPLWLSPQPKSLHLVPKQSFFINHLFPHFSSSVFSLN